MRPSCLLSPLRTLVFATFLYLLGPAPAQAQSPYLYASSPGGGATSQVAGFSANLDGTLTPISGSPFNLSREGGLVTTDPDDQFLFVLNRTSNMISVLAIDPNTGALTEVSGSPVPTPGVRCLPERPRSIHRSHRGVPNRNAEPTSNPDRHNNVRGHAG